MEQSGTLAGRRTHISGAVSMRLVGWLAAIGLWAAWGIFVVNARWAPLQEVRDAQRVTGYARTTGRMVESYVAAGGGGRHGGGTRLKVAVRYEYDVGGTVFTGSRIGTTDMEWPSEQRSAAEATAAQWKAGRTVEVRYDPADPAQAILIDDSIAYDPSLAYILTGLLVLAPGALVGLYWFLGTKRSS